MPQRNVATNFTFEQQRQEINLLAADFWTQKGTVDTAAPTYLKHDGSNSFTGQTLNVPNAFTINANSGSGTLTISGNLDVTGTTTTVSTANLEVTDKNILIAKGSSSDAQADGAGITIDSATDITFNFVDAKDALVSSIGLEGTTFLKAPYGQFLGSGTPTTGQGVEINAPDTNTGQISSYDRANTAYKELRIKGSSVGIYGGTANALVGSFNSTGLDIVGNIDSTVSSGDNSLKIETTTSGDPQLNLNAAGAGGHVIEYIRSTNTLNFKQGGGSVRMSIAAGGDVSIANNLDVTGNVEANSDLFVGAPASNSLTHKLLVQAAGDANAIAIIGRTDGIGELSYYANDASTKQGEIQFRDAELNIRHRKENADIKFWTTPTGGTITERLTITSDGTITQTAANPILELKGTASTSGNTFLHINANANHWCLGADNYTSLNLFVIKSGTPASSDHRVAINGDGNVGIGSTNPTQPLTLKRSSSGQTAFGLRFEYENTVGPTSTSSAVLVGSDGLTFKNYNSSRNFIFETGKLLLGTSTSNTSDCVTFMDPGDAFMSLRSDQHQDLVAQHLDFIVGTNNRASGNMVSAIRSQVPNNTTAGGTLKGELSFWTNQGDSITEQLTIHSDGSLRTSVGSEISHKSGGSSLVYADLEEIGITDNDNGYKTMKLWKADKGGSFTLDVSMMNQAGQYYWSYIVYNVTQGIRVNQNGSGGDSNNLRFNDGLASGQSADVHNFRRFSIACGASLGSVRSGDQLELRMASTDINGNIVTGVGQRLRARGLKIFSTTGNPGTGAIDGAGYNAAMNTRNCCYWWLDRNGNYNGYNSQNESTSIPFNRLVESANFSDDGWSNGVVTIQQDGVYALNASAYSTTGGVAFTQGWWIVSGSRHTGCDIVLPTTGNIMSMSGFMYLTAGQTVGYHVHYSGSSSVQINDNAYHTYFRGCLINATNATRNSYA